MNKEMIKCIEGFVRLLLDEIQSDLSGISL